MAEEHHASISSVIHRYIDYISHIALEGDFSDEDLQPLPYKNDAPIGDKISGIMQAMTETNMKIRYLEWHPEEESVKDMGKLERRYAALDHHMNHIIAENHLEHLVCRNFASAQ